MGPTRGASHGPAGLERERGAHAEQHRDREHRRPEREAARGYSPAARGSPGRGSQKSQNRPNKRRHKNCDHARDRTQCARRGSSSFTGRPDTVEGPIASQGRRGRRRWSRGGRPREEHQQEHTGGGASDPGGISAVGTMARLNKMREDRDSDRGCSTASLPPTLPNCEQESV